MLPRPLSGAGASGSKSPRLKISPNRYVSEHHLACTRPQLPRVVAPLLRSRKQHCTSARTGGSEHRSETPRCSLCPQCSSLSFYIHHSSSLYRRHVLLQNCVRLSLLVNQLCVMGRASCCPDWQALMCRICVSDHTSKCSM